MPPRADRPHRLRCIDDPPGDPYWNMALDEALLLGDEPATLRCYGWSPHAVSLGYFQRHADFADVPAAVPIVRRLTGGGAIHHGDELTWSLAIDGPLLPRTVDDAYALLHDAIAAALAAIGVRVRRLREGAAPSARPSDRWCFALPGRHDLVTDDGRKLCGSAQRRLRTARGERVLHHGSIVHARPGLTPFVAALADTRDAALLAPVLRRALAREFAARLGLALEPAPVTDAERSAATAARGRRYATPAFVAGR